MTLSPLEIRNQDFSKSPIGYKRDEVKLFLAQVAESIAENQKERDHLARRLETLTKRISELEAQSGAIGQALDLAKKEGQEIIERAEEQAKIIRENADSDAQKVMAQYANQINETKQELYELTTIKNTYFRKLMRVLELQGRALKEFDEEYESRRIKASIETLSAGFQIEFPLSDNLVFGNSTHRRRRASLFPMD
ncbi:DivIVA domain-containing protein [bacterium]|nr:DivIVA domain-containing protein [bacterium]